MVPSLGPCLVTIISSSWHHPNLWCLRAMTAQLPFSPLILQKPGWSTKLVIISVREVDHLPRRSEKVVRAVNLTVLLLPSS
jgi:hypothetical protein